MFGHRWPGDADFDARGVLAAVVEGVDVVLGVDWVVVVALLELLGAATAPAMPAAAPAVARAPARIPERIMLALLIHETSCGRLVEYFCRPSCVAPLSGPLGPPKRSRKPS
jgi:hypothetical protein